MKHFFALLACCAFWQFAFAYPHIFDCVVAQDGSGHYATIQDAVDAAPRHSATPYLIFIKAGHYHEHIYIPEDKPRLCLIGEDSQLVRISDDRVSGGPNASPVDVAATLVCHATDTYFTGITFENSWGTRHHDGPQALALYTKRDRTIVNRCSMLSYQDTYRTANVMNERNFVNDCFIEGAVDFIYGQGNVYFNHCTLNIVAREGGFIVAPKHDEGTTWGYVFKNTTITAPGNPAATTVWLGRPWLHAPKASFVDTRCEVTIPAEGWFDHMASLPAVYAEYNTMNADGTPMDLSRRTNRYYKITEDKDTVWGTAKHLLTADEAAQLTIDRVMGGSDGWNPLSFCAYPAMPVVSCKGKRLSWSAVPGVRGYAIKYNNKVVALTTDLSWPIKGNAKGYVVYAIGEYGNMSRPDAPEGSLVADAVEASPTVVEPSEQAAGYLFDKGHALFLEQMQAQLTYPLAWGNSDIVQYEAWRAAARNKLEEEMLMPPPPSPAFSPVVVAEEQRKGYKARKLKFRLSAFSEVNAYALVPDGKGPFPAVLLLHDHGGHFSIGKEKMIKPFDVPDSVVADADEWCRRCYGGQYVGDYLAAHGYVVLCTDAPFWGERGVKGGTRWDDYKYIAGNFMMMGANLGSWMCFEDVYAVDFLASMPEVDKERVGCMGFSMGAYRSWMLSALTDRVRCGVAICWMHTTAYQVNREYGLVNHEEWPNIVPGIRRYLDYPHIASIACPKPMLFINGRKDRLFPAAAVEDAFATMHKVWSSQQADDRLETELWDMPHYCGPEVQERFLKFLEKHLH